MSLEDFQLMDNEPIDNIIMKKDYSNVYHQQGGLLKDPDQNLEFIIGEINKYHQAGKSHLEFDITGPKADGNNFNFTIYPATNQAIGLMNSGFA